MAECTVDGCEDPIKAKGMCHRHRMAAWRYGDPLAAPRGPRKKGTLAERFWSDVRRGAPDECWEWSGAVNDGGYGVISRKLAHRVSFEIENGYLPAAVLHRCDNPPCVNPAHLRGGTQADNLADCVAKVRHGRPSPRLRDSDVYAVLADSRPQKVIAQEYGVSRSLVSLIRSGKRRTSVITTRGMK